MKKINNLEDVSASSRATAIIAGITCTAAFFNPITAIIFTPTCAGMLFATWYD